ncbi:hypothetical protein F9K81_00225 [Brucella anthropi]|uniref:hypothetical protein n=1 Tax=Brucella anthropi TaxID=529 RepID=UPI00124EB994|nr:hypothetical protein [Brucella anthropi]KAB2759924.1 hypothetical protein F9K81_00225 [Brucella anthropi]
MKHAFIMAAILLSTSAAQAGEPTKDELCAGWGRLAAKVMELRQMDAPMSDLMKDADNKEIAKAQRAVIVAAYNEPSYMSKDGKRKAVDTFRNKIELDCYNAN